MTGILIYGGQLRDSYAQKNRDHISRVRKDGFEEGSKHWLAFWHEWGTSPYMIYPRFSRALRFMTARGFAMASKVRHPGLPARPTAIYQDEDIDFIMELLMREVDRG